LRRAFGRGNRHLHADHQIPIEERPPSQAAASCAGELTSRFCMRDRQPHSSQIRF
jgi:hypothetical protein